MAKRGWLRRAVLDGVAKTASFHRMVLLAFKGACPSGMEAAHLDGNPRNNRVDNLAWCTKLENNQQRVAHGTQARGERVGVSKLKEREVLEIRGSQDISYAKLGRAYGVCVDTIRKIITRETWTHI